MRIVLIIALCVCSLSVTPVRAASNATRSLVFLPIEIDSSYDDLLLSLSREDDVGFGHFPTFFTAIPMRINFELGSSSLRWLEFNWSPRYSSFLSWAKAHQVDQADSYFHEDESTSLAAYDITAMLSRTAEPDQQTFLTAVVYEVSPQQLFALVAVPSRIVIDTDMQRSLPIPDGDIILIVSQDEDGLYGLFRQDVKGSYQRVLSSRRGGKPWPSLCEPGVVCGQASGSYFAKEMAPVIVKAINTGIYDSGYVTLKLPKSGNYPKITYLRDDNVPFKAWRYPGGGAGDEVVQLDVKDLIETFSAMRDVTLMLFTLRDGTTAIIVYE
jgi:hypothetical protein